jgi:superfamily II DNA or RNA helicase
MSLIGKKGFYRKYDLDDCREQKSVLEPVIHQKEAINEMANWFNQRPENAGGILALPTGSGKTVTAVRFLCQYPLSQGYKVLWLAHTHHLLEQAFFTFGPKYEKSDKGYEVGYISEPREELKVRVVSGAQHFYPPKQIKKDDDVIIATLQTIRGAYEKEEPHFMNFLDSASDKLFVVFDEAHHAAAPSFRRLIENLRERHPDMYLLGLTATPTAATENKKMWLKKLFPQSNISQTTLDKLMADEILSKPVFKNINTEIKADFDQGEFQKWVNNYKDLPQKIIKHLAENKERNKLIAQNYVDNKGEYGKTIIFTDRWYQCTTLCKFLQNRGVKADVMFTKVDKSLGTAGTAQKNLEVLEDFKNGNLDVLINIKMLTEGTDVPDAETVFLTRQTTSQILLTQMIGRALRGPKFGGTETANIVSFVDDWEYEINWAEWDPLPGDEPEDDSTDSPPKIPLELISIKLVIDWANERDKDGEIVSDCNFTSLMPSGWYLTEFDIINEDKDPESIKDFVLVFEEENQAPERDSYEKFIIHLKNENLEIFEDENLEFNLDTDSNVNKSLEKWFDKFFSFTYSENKVNDVLRNLFKISRHMAQNDKESPKYFNFEDRQKHDLDSLAKTYAVNELGPTALNDASKAEYEKEDRYWKALYPDFRKFKSEVDYRIFRYLNPPKKFSSIKPWINDDDDPDREPLPEDLRNLIFKSDNFVCQCCGEDNVNLLEIDHIKPRYYVHDNSADNLQLLCKTCNGLKRTETIDFRTSKTPLKKSPTKFPALTELNRLDETQFNDYQWWEKFLRRKINFFYKCGAARSTNIYQNDEFLDSWEITFDGDPNWISQFLLEFTQYIRQSREDYGLSGPEELIIPSVLDHIYNEDVVIVPAKFAIEEYFDHSVYMCPPDRPFRNVEYLGLYADGKVSRYIPKILGVVDNFVLSQDLIQNSKLLSDEKKEALLNLVKSLEEKDDQNRLYYASKVFFLSSPDSYDTIKLENDIINDKKSDSGKKVAFTQGTRYIPIEKFKNNPKTTSELE